MEAVIFTGIQASGKTTFYRERFFETHVRISLDMLRTRRRELILLQACLSAQQRFVIDNTNVRMDERARYIHAAREAGFRVIGYSFAPDVRGAIARNKNRRDKRAIPVKGLIGTYKRLQPPLFSEGFDELYLVSLDPEKGFVVVPFDSRSAEKADDRAGARQ